MTLFICTDWCDRA